jgi:anti-sigma-K factor RskA
MAYSEDHIALAAEYVLGTLDADERALVETMMIVDHGFNDLVDAWDRKLAPLHQMVGPIEPPAELWDRIKVAAGVGLAPTPDVLEATPPGEAADSAVDAVASEINPVPDESVVAPEPAVSEPVAAPVAPIDVPETIADQRETVAAAAPDVASPLARRRARVSRIYSVVMTAIAAALAAVVALQAYRPELLPEGLRIKPRVRVVEVRAPAPSIPAQSVAMLQQSATQPGFILTVETATRQFTVRRVGATAVADKSYELWLVSDRLPQPRSLGVIGEGEFTVRPGKAYAADVVSRATYVVTIEPKGGSPTGVATGPTVYSGKLVESVPAGASSTR